MKKPEAIEIYTDGSCKGNPGPGGWCAIVLNKKTQKPVAVLKGREKNTTNNRMEMVAVIEGLRYIVTNKLFSTGGEKIIIYSDSNLIVQTLMKGWKRKANLDLWRELDELNEELNVSFFWIKGHSHHYWNNECDKIAQIEARMAATRHLL